MRNLFLSLIVVLLSLFVVSPVALAQNAGQGGPAASSRPFDPKELSTGFTGVWSMSGVNPIGDLMTGEPPMTPAGLAKYKSEKTEYQNPPVSGVENTDPLYRCEPNSPPRHYFNGHPIEFIQSPNAVIMLIEAYRNFRIFYTDGRKHPNHPEGTWYGDSVARWDGNTLVVDSINFNDRTWVDRLGHPHSDKMRLTERITRTAYDRMRIDITVDDPANYTAPWGGPRNFVLRPGWIIEDYLCSPKDEAQLFKLTLDPAMDKTGK